MLALIFFLSAVFAAAYVWGSILFYRKTPETPPVLVFEWSGQRVEVASGRLVEWLALRQLHSEEWPPMKDLLLACKMLGMPTTEEKLRKDVWEALPFVRRALRRGQNAITTEL